MTAISVYYLQMLSVESLTESPAVDDLMVMEARQKNFRLNRFLYQLVGEDWQWRDKLALSDQAWRDSTEADNVRTWVAYCEGAIAGYYEMRRDDQCAVEIVYFGLAPDFIGRGFGSDLLCRAVRSAWGWTGTQRVWLHTCSLDHPHALANYQRRGFQLYSTEIEPA